MLIIDDDEWTHLVLTEELRALGVDVTDASDDESAMRLLDARPFSVVALDPYRTGADRTATSDLIERIRRSNGSPAIVILSSYPASLPGQGQDIAMIDKRSSKQAAERLAEIWKARKSNCLKQC